MVLEISLWLEIKLYDSKSNYKIEINLEVSWKCLNITDIYFYYLDLYP